MKRLAIVAVAAAASLPLAAAPAQANPHRSYSWALTPSGSTARLRGLAAVSDRVAWASGSLGTILRTVDGGAHWTSVGPAGTSDLQFRDIEAFDADHAVALSIGPGTDSRVYVTADGGATWAQTFTNTDPNAFYDCAAFGDRQHGLAVSDPVDGKFRIIATSDGGQTWSVVDPAGMPAALPGEAGFAASGTCLVALGRDYWLGSGGGATARVYHSRDLGRTWTVADTPVRSSGTSGIFSLAFRSPREGFAIGGDFLDPTRAGDLLALTHDAGATWEGVNDTAPPGYRSGSAWLPRTGRTAIAVGPTGSDVTVDGGRTWTTFDTGTFDSVSCGTDGACWASGAQGRIARLVVTD